MTTFITILTWITLLVLLFFLRKYMENKLFTILLIFLFIGCSKYQVVQEVRVNMYHLHNPKTKKAEIIITTDSLVVGKMYRLGQINIIDPDNYFPPDLKSR